MDVQVARIVSNSRTRVAILGSVADFHNEAISFDMAHLMRLVAAINPDLLCLDITPTQWLARDFVSLPSEYRKALLPLANQTDIVVVPIGSRVHSNDQAISGWRRALIDRLQNWIGAIQRAAPSPEALNQGWRHDWVNYLYAVIHRLSGTDGRSESQARADLLAQQVLTVSRRDPGTRVLVVVNVQYCHLIRRQLRECAELLVTSSANL